LLLYTSVLFARFKKTGESGGSNPWLYIELGIHKNEGSGKYYSRLGRQGFRTLKTDKISVARLRLSDRLKEYKGEIRSVDSASRGDVSMRQVLDLLLESSNADTNLAPATKRHHKICLQRLEKTWPELGGLRA